MNKTNWFVYSIFLGASPTIVSFFVYLGGGSSDYFKIEELIFWGLAMNISNISLTTMRKIEKKKSHLISWSLLLIIFLSVILGIVKISTQIHYLLTLCITMMLIGCIYLSYSTNEYVYSKAKK